MNQVVRFVFRVVGLRVVCKFILRAVTNLSLLFVLGIRIIGVHGLAFPSKGLLSSGRGSQVPRFLKG